MQAASLSPYRDDGKYLRVCTFIPPTARIFNLFICRYCPGGPDSDFDYSTQSYTGYEPTSMRAIRARYDPYEQTRGRVEQLKSLGHNVDKVCYLVTYWRISIAIRIAERFLGGIYRNGRNIYEHARRLPREVHRTATQCSFRFYGYRCRRSCKVCAFSLLTFTRLLIPVSADILSRVNQKPSVSQSRPVRITVYAPILGMPTAHSLFDHDKH